jgi:hypothetical protein
LRLARDRSVDDAAGVDGLLHRGDDQPQPVLGDRAVAELEHLVEVVPGVDVHHRERHAGGPERLLGQVQHDDRVLAAGEQQHGPLELGGDLADDVDGLGFDVHPDLLHLHAAEQSAAAQPPARRRP